MGTETAIAWTDHSFNPWWGCHKVSPGCNNCYAESTAKRYGKNVWGPKTERRMMSDHHWRQPLRWDRDAAAAGRPALVFCASMADVFEDRRDLDEVRARLWALIEATPNLIWQLLTKRPQNVERLVPTTWSAEGEWPPNVWLGTTTEDQRRADERVPILLDIFGPAVHFISYEPAIGPLVLHPLWTEVVLQAFGANGARLFPRIGWIIAGGESGGGRRPMDLAWLEAVRRQAEAEEVPLFVKQDGGAVAGQQGRIPDDLWAVKEFPPSAQRSAVEA